MPLSSKPQDVLKGYDGIFGRACKGISKQPFLNGTRAKAFCSQEAANLAFCRFCQILIPFHQCIVIMSSGIDDHVFFIRNAVTSPFSPCLNRKYQYLHALQMIVLLESHDFRPQFAQVFRHQFHLWKAFCQKIQHLISRCLDPLSFDSSRTGGRDFPECVKSPEMIDPYDIEQLSAVADPVHPELVSAFFHVLPVINRIAPTLSGSTEIIRRDSRNKHRSPICVQEKIIFSAPHVCRIQSHIKRNVPHDPDTFFICGYLDFHPLAIEDILKECVEPGFFLLFSSQLSFSLREVLVLCLPFIPAHASVRLFQSTEGRIGLDPV